MLVCGRLASMQRPLLTMQSRQVAEVIEQNGALPASNHARPNASVSPCGVCVGHSYTLSGARKRLLS
jgi:hypothetical protein